MPEETKLDSDRPTDITLEPHPHDVRITVEGVELARTRDALLWREGYAPDIYVPPGDLAGDVLVPSGRREQSNLKGGTAEYLDARLDGGTVAEIAWRYPDPRHFPALRDHVAFDFDRVRIEVDGKLVRGHVRDPKKVITVEDLGARLTLEIAGQVVADTSLALVLRETGLPARYYVPAADFDLAVLGPSDRRTVCTYKGEAEYWHLSAGGKRHENAVWSYPEPWTDFAAGIGRLQGHFGTYASLFDRVLIDGVPQPAGEDAARDAAMIASPTVDREMRVRGN
jgi:uncharacterized protein (DUF427 family)